MLECHCGGHGPEDALRVGLTLDLCTFTIADKFDGTPLAMFGCGGEDTDEPYIWALASDLLVPRAGRDFIRHSPEWIKAMLKAVGGKASNYVHAENTDATRWLLYCGAEFSDEIFLKNNQPFLKFTITQDRPRGKRNQMFLSTTENPFTELLDNSEFFSKPDEFIDKVEKGLIEYAPAECPLVHRFTKGMYIREIFIPKGTLLTSMKHKTEHPFVISKGEIAVMSANENKVIYKAPFTGITKPQTRRVLYAIEDTIWTTFHVTDKTNIDEIGAELLEESSNNLLEKDHPRLNQWKKQILTIR